MTYFTHLALYITHLAGEYSFWDHQYNTIKLSASSPIRLILPLPEKRSLVYFIHIKGQAKIKVRFFLSTATCIYGMKNAVHCHL